MLHLIIMALINSLGDNLLVVLNSSNNFTSKINLTTPIVGQKYFRAIASTTVFVECSFAKSSYQLYADGSSALTREILCSNSVWHNCDNQNISTGETIKYTPPTSGFDRETEISIYFQFFPYFPDSFLLPAN